MQASAKIFLIAVVSAGILLAHRCQLIAAETNVNSRPATTNSTTSVSPVFASFVSQKHSLEESIAKKHELKVPPLIQDFFAAASNANWETTSNLFFKIEAGVYHRNSTGWMPPEFWGAVHDTFGTYEIFNAWNPDLLDRYGHEFVKSIPPGSIYFGGTEAGRFVFSAFSQSHSKGQPFFTLTQNALTDNTYLTYLTDMYGEKIYIPSTNDSQKCIEEYTADARARLKHDEDFPSAPRQIKRGEDVRVVNGTVQFNGQIAVISINALMAKVIFDKNLTHEFYYEQSIPLDWMYPHLTPHQFIMKLNREPLKEISPQNVLADREFWKRQTDSWFGPWLNTSTSVSEIGDFWERIYLKKDFTGFAGDLRFINDPETQRAFSRMRCAIAALYAWRATNSKNPLERERMKTEADFAFRQALALCPVSPEIIFRYIDLLTADNRLSDAVRIVNSARKLDPDNQMWRWQDLLEQLLRAKSQADKTTPAK